MLATQPLAITAATAAAAVPDLAPPLGRLAVALWGVGVVLYLMLIAVVTVHLLELPAAPHALSPTYWIYMVRPESYTLVRAPPLCVAM